MFWSWGCGPLAFVTVGAIDVTTVLGWIVLSHANLPNVFVAVRHWCRGPVEAGIPVLASPRCSVVSVPWSIA